MSSQKPMPWLEKLMISSSLVPGLPAGGAAQREQQRPGLHFGRPSLAVPGIMGRLLARWAQI